MIGTHGINIIIGMTTLVTCMYNCRRPHKRTTSTPKTLYNWHNYTSYSFIYTIVLTSIPFLFLFIFIYFFILFFLFSLFCFFHYLTSYGYNTQHAANDATRPIRLMPLGSKTEEEECITVSREDNTPFLGWLQIDVNLTCPVPVSAIVYMIMWAATNQSMEVHNSCMRL